MTLAPFRATAEWTVATIAPSGSWDGTTSWGGRSVPTESGSAYGSGWTQKTIGNFDTPPYQWITADTHIAVVCDHGDSSWIDYVDFWCEGTTTRVTRNGYNPDTGAIGFVVKVQPPAGTDGDADIYAKIVPVNGYERLVGPLRVIFNKGGTITRTVKTVKTSGGDYATIREASNAALDGWIIKVDAGTWAEDPNGVAYGGAALSRGFEIRPADGVSASQVVITRSTRAPLRAFTRPKTVFRNVTFETSTINTFYDGDVRVFIGCLFYDANGIKPAPGYQVNDLTTFFRGDEGQVTYLDNVIMRQPQCAGWKFARNSLIEFSADACTIRGETNQSADYVIINVRAFENGNYGSRRHVPSSLTVSTVSYNAGTGRTTITCSGSPSTDDVSSVGSDDIVYILTGALAGQSFQLYSLTNATDTVVLTGNASSLVAGDTLWVANLYHCDTFQTFGNTSTPDYQNLIAQRYWTRGDYTQPFFLQTSNASAVQKDIAFQLCIFDCGALSQYQNKVQNVVFRQCTHTGSGVDLRNDLPYWNATDCVIEGCVLKSLNLSGGSMVSGFDVADCHFVTGSSYSTSGATTGSAGLGSDYRPTAGSAVLAGCTTKFPFDYYLNRWTGTVAKGACKEVS